MVIRAIRVTSGKSMIGILTHQGHISKVNANAEWRTQWLTQWLSSLLERLVTLNITQIKLWHGFSKGWWLLLPTVVQIKIISELVLNNWMLLRVFHPSHFVRMTDKLEQNQFDSYPFLSQFCQISFANGILPMHVELFTDNRWMISYNRKEDIYLYSALAPSKMKKCKNTSKAVQNLYPFPKKIHLYI